MHKVSMCDVCGEQFEYEAGVQGSLRKNCPDCTPLVNQDRNRKRYERLREEDSGRTCEGCGKPLKRAQRQYCSASCANQASGEQRHKYYRCKYCGKEFYPKKSDRTSFCSRDCNYAYRKEHVRPKPEKPAKPAKYCGVCGKECDGIQFYCSDACRKELARRKAKVYHSAKKELKPRKCKECGSEFTSEYGDRRRTFCSRSCSKRWSRRKRPTRGTFNHRAKRILGRLYGAVLPMMYERINREKVLNRDKWTCGICGEPIDKHEKCPHPMSASVDHVVALSDGGPHLYSNVQAAHFMCNSVKGGREGRPT